MKLALLVIDMQGRFEEMSREMNIVGNVVAVIEACHKAEVPVFFTQHHDPVKDGVLYNWWKDPIIKGTDGWKFIREIAQTIKEDNDVKIDEKTRYDAFHNTRLKEELHKREVDTVVICGAMTNLCCETTARVAFVNDFNVIFLRDGNATSTQEFHDAAIKNLEFGFTVMKTCKEFIDSIA